MALLDNTIPMSIKLENTREEDSVYHFFNKRRSEGKTYDIYMTARANKFLCIYYGKVKEFLRNLEQIE